VYASRTTGKYDHVSALAGAIDVKGHSVRRGNSQLVHVCNLAWGTGGPRGTSVAWEGRVASYGAAGPGRGGYAIAFAAAQARKNSALSFGVRSCVS